MGAAQNARTFTLRILAAAANPTNTVLAAFTGTAAAIVCTITPNDGTNNTVTPVDITEGQLVELINTGLISGKSITLTDASALRNDQTAVIDGSGLTVLSNGGAIDDAVGTFAGGVG